MKFMTSIRLYLLVYLLLSCSTFVLGDSVVDPFEKVNRKIFAFNDFVDGNMLAPVAKGYQVLAPQFVDNGVSNMFANLGDVSSAINNILQWELTAALTDSGRFLINLTLGLAGFFDVATYMGMERQPADFGQTLGAWGADSGPYFMVPFFGPATMRSGVGTLFDSQLSVISQIDHIVSRNATYALDIVDNRADLINADEMISGDRYIFIRDVYIQQREYFVTGLLVDDFGEEDPGDDDIDWGD
jgi:phospholipid-binding lipoprotein MlaA